MMENENKENVVGLPENFPNVSIISDEPLVTKKRKKGGCNLRNSLAWNPAFLSDEGVLDSDELSSLGGSLHHHDGILLSSNNRGEEKPMARLPRISEHVLSTKEHGNDTVSFLSRDYNLDQRIDFQPRLSHQERNGYKESAVDQSVKAMNLVPRYGGCPQPSGLNLQGRITKTANSGILPAFSDYKAPHLDIKNGSLKLYKTPLSDARVEDKSSFMRIKSSADSVNWAHRLPPANVHSSQDRCTDGRKSPVVILQKPSRLRMPSPSLGFFSKGEPKLGNSAMQDGALNVKVSTSECVSSSSCFPHSKLTASYHPCSSKLKANKSLKSDGRFTSKYPDVSLQEVICGSPTKRRVRPKDGMSTKIPLLSGRLKSDTGNKIIADLKLGNMLVMENSTDLLQPISSHAVKVGRPFESHVIPTGNEDQYQDGCVTGNSDQEQDSLFCLNRAVIERAEVVDMSEKDATLTFRKSSESKDLKAMAKTCLKTDIGFSQDENSDSTTGSINCNDHEANFDRMPSREVEMQTTSERVHLPTFGEEEPENSTVLGSDSKSEGRDIANNNDCKGLMSYSKGISVMKREPEDIPTDTNLELLLYPISSHCERKFESEFILPPEVVDLQLMRDIEPGEKVEFRSQQEADSMVNIDIQPDKSLDQNGSSVPIVDPLFDRDCHGELENKEDHGNHTQSTSPSGLNHPESKKMLEKENVLQSAKQDPCHMKLNAVPFSDEWLAALESVGEEFLTKKTGVVQNSPPKKMVPEPSPWSPIPIRIKEEGWCHEGHSDPNSNKGERLSAILEDLLIAQSTPMLLHQIPQLIDLLDRCSKGTTAGGVKEYCTG